MKVLLVNKFFYKKGGAERVFFDTKNILEEYGHEVIEFAMQNPNNEPSKYSKYFVAPTEFHSIKGVFSAYKNLYSFETKRRLEELVLAERPDIAHLHNAYFQISPSIFSVFKKYKIPVVYTVHDYHLICPNYQLYTKDNICERCKYYKYYNAVFHKCKENNLIKSSVIASVMSFNKIFKFYERGVDHFITPSIFMKRKLLEWDFCREDKITNIPLSVDLQNFHATNNVKDRKYILYFGRFSFEKGILVFLSALEKCKTKNINIKLMGDGPFMQEVRNAIQSFAKNKNIEILPYQNDVQKIAQIVSGAQAVVLPSVWYENYPMSVLEAFACGTPVIASNIGGIPELVKENKTGYLFSPKDSNTLASQIDLVYNDFDLIEKLGQNARDFVSKNNSRQVYYEKLINIYKDQI